MTRDEFIELDATEQAAKLNEAVAAGKAIYTVDGKKVAAPVKGQIYVVDGKVVKF